MPLVGWAMLSAARYPIVLYGALHLPPILPHDPMSTPPAPGAPLFRLSPVRRRSSPISARR